MDRRSVLTLGGVAVSSLIAGCGQFTLDRSVRDPGSLVITNDQDKTRTVTVHVELYSEKPESDSPGIETPARTPRDRWTTRVEVSPGEEVVRNGFITDPGTYYVTAETRSGLHGTTWADFYAATESTAVGGGVIRVDLQENGHLSVGNPVDD